MASQGAPWSVGALWKPTQIPTKIMDAEEGTCTPTSSEDESSTLFTPGLKSDASSDCWEQLEQLTSEDGESVEDATLEMRRWLLGFRRLGTPVPTELATLRTSTQGAASSPAPTREHHRRRSAGTAAQPRLVSSEKAYRRLGSGTSMGRKEELQRCMMSLLNKICPENCKAIARRIRDEAKVVSISELEIVIMMIFTKALSEPHYCQTYADLVFYLKNEMPEFVSEDGVKPVTFQSSLVTVCQNEFESMPKTLEPTPEEAAQYSHEELNARKSQSKARLLANMRFIGNLFLRNLLATKVVDMIAQDLLLCNSEAQDMNAPEEHVVECICELVVAIGLTLEAVPLGGASLAQVCRRLLELKQMKTPEGCEVYSKRIQFIILDLLELREVGWAQKVFKGPAKTKEQVRLEQQREFSGLERKSKAQIVMAGQRPACLDEALF